MPAASCCFPGPLWAPTRLSQPTHLGFCTLPRQFWVCPVVAQNPRLSGPSLWLSAVDGSYIQPCITQPAAPFLVGHISMLSTGLLHSFSSACIHQHLLHAQSAIVVSSSPAYMDSLHVHRPCSLLSVSLAQVYTNNEHTIYIFPLATAIVNSQKLADQQSPTRIV
jgi:hypothetical protein